MSAGTLAVGCGVAVASLLQGCAAIRYVDGVIDSDKIRVNKNEFIEQHFVIVTSKDLQAPIYVVKSKEDDTYSAFLMLCTHLNCELRPTGTFLSCPCHGSEFSNKGEVLQGPASTSLAYYEVVEEEQEIIIDLNKLKKS
ncbi:MAG: cytochrome b6-f complex iron-sulfur subunit [Crocinitomicaceae bacterium]|jgi:cytochrome b6-f complex iron-sulfur subunit